VMTRSGFWGTRPAPYPITLKDGAIASVSLIEAGAMAGG
jgi:hypothetical protein